MWMKRYHIDTWTSAWLLCMYSEQLGNLIIKRWALGKARNSEQKRSALRVCYFALTYAWQLQIESFPSGFLSFSVPASIVGGYMISSASYYSCNQSFVEYAKWDRNTTMIDFATRLHTVQLIGNTNPKRKDSVTHGAHTQVHRTWDQLVAYTVTIYHVTLFVFFDAIQKSRHYADPQLDILSPVTSACDLYGWRHNSIDDTAPAARWPVEPTLQPVDTHQPWWLHGGRQPSPNFAGTYITK